MKHATNFCARSYKSPAKRRVLFIIPYIPVGERIYASESKLDRGGSFILPLGVAYVAAAARKAGHEVSVLNVDKNSRDMEEIVTGSIRSGRSPRGGSPSGRPDVIGIACFVENFDACLQIAGIIKRLYPRIRIVFGGPQAAAVPEMFLANGSVDAVVTGEGEIPFCRLLQLLDQPGQWHKIRGICFKNGAGRVTRTPGCPLIRDMDTIPMPALDLYPMDFSFSEEFKIGDKKTVALLGSRGCPFRCSYCASHVVWGRTFRSHSAKRIVSEMKELHAKYGFESFVFYDDLLTFDRKRTLALCDAITGAGRGYIWCGNTRADLVDPELLRAMKRAGCYFISYGIESSSRRLLKRLRKGVTPEQNIRAIEMTRHAGIKAGATFLIGLPTETLEETRETIKFAINLKLDFANFSITAPLMKTELMTDALKNGYFKKGRTADDIARSSDVWIPNGRTRKELEKWQTIGVKACQQSMGSKS